MTRSRSGALVTAGFWTLAVILTGVWHLLWFPLHAARKPHLLPPLPPTLARLAFYGGAVLRSPLLFSLRPAGAPDNREAPDAMSRPPLSVPPPLPVVSCPAIPALPVPHTAPLSREWMADDPAPAQSPEWARTEPFPRRPDAHPTRIEGISPWTSQSLSPAALPDEISTPQPWTARVWFRFQTNGIPADILIEAPDLPMELRARLRIALQGWRLARDETERAGVVLLRQDGRPTSAGGAVP